jgi:hypothetical protein
MAAGLTDKLFEMTDLMAIVDAAEELASSRRPYRRMEAA